MSDQLENLEQIPSSCGSFNPGGVNKIEYAPVSWFESFPEFRKPNNTLSVAPTFISGKGWLTIPHANESLDYKEDVVENDQGKPTRVVASGSVPQETVQLNNQFEIMKENYFIIKVTDKAGLVKLVGTPTNPLEFNFKYSPGKNQQALRGYDFTFTADLFRKPPIVAF